METTTTETGCCPIFNPEPYDNKIFEWKSKNFVKARVKTMFFMPLNFGKVITRTITEIDRSGAKMPEGMCLSDHTSRWNMDILLGVDKEIDGMDNVKLDGKFLSRVYEGSYSKTDEWCKDFTKAAAEQGFSVKKWYMWYNYCPKCAKHYGKNYTTIICEVE